MIIYAELRRRHRGRKRDRFVALSCFYTMQDYRWSVQKSAQPTFLNEQWQPVFELLLTIHRGLLPQTNSFFDAQGTSRERDHAAYLQYCRHDYSWSNIFVEMITIPNRNHQLGDRQSALVSTWDWWLTVTQARTRYHFSVSPVTTRNGGAKSGAHRSTNREQATTPPTLTIALWVYAKR